MWANRDWVGPVFPADTKIGDELHAYATWCTTVEGNTTFYAPPPPASVEKWAASAPDTFRFCFKLPQDITHNRRLRNVEEPLWEFLDLLEPLGDRVGPLQIQLPGSFGPEDQQVLGAFLRSLPSDRIWALEVRHAEFFAGGNSERPLDDMLAELGINRVILDSRAFFASVPVTREEREAWERKPRLPVRPVATSNNPIIRLIGQSDVEASLEHWAPWVPKLAEWVAAGVEPHVFTHTPDNRDSPILARRLWSLVDAEVADLEPLPTPLRGDQQLGFF